VILFFMNPAAFVVAFFALMGALEVAREESIWPLGVFFLVYILAVKYLPWWTRPILLWRYWRRKRQLRKEQELFPTWPQKPV
jgi:hypothetical protein